jgi:hypothetical protein
MIFSDVSCASNVSELTLASTASESLLSSSSSQLHSVPADAASSEAAQKYFRNFIVLRFW